MVSVASHGRWVLQAELQAVLALIGLLLLLRCSSRVVLRLCDLSIVLLVLSVHILLGQVLALMLLEMVIERAVRSGASVLPHFLQVVVGRKCVIRATRPLACPILIGLATLNILLISIHPFCCLLSSNMNSKFKNLNSNFCF